MSQNKVNADFYAEYVKRYGQLKSQFGTVGKKSTLNKFIVERIGDRIVHFYTEKTTKNEISGLIE